MRQAITTPGSMDMSIYEMARLPLPPLRMRNDDAAPLEAIRADDPRDAPR